ncbi:PadR family transcriptional regulator [Pararhizobium sp. LjRoot238]|uniref:PadR family transcriptional regulator n=1 Tax=Pararhizobium sp. LjRoot238 TaxID=3342293 RepID=UPI003ED05D3F
MIGKFEELTLIALIKAGPRVHAARVHDVLEASMEKSPPFAALYTALDRMTKKGMISETKDENDSRGKRLFTITGEGRRALDEAVNATRAVNSYGGKPALGVARHG